MSRLRSSAPRLVGRIVSFLGASRNCGTSETADPLVLAEDAIILALVARENAGEVTTLRQLHKIVGLNQPEALGIANRLERDGVVQIDPNLGDAFESTIALDDGARIRLEQKTGRRAG